MKNGSSTCAMRGHTCLISFSLRFPAAKSSAACFSLRRKRSEVSALAIDNRAAAKEACERENTSGDKDE